MTILALDFGTSNTVVCLHTPDGRQETLELLGLSHRYDAGPPLVPTLVYAGQPPLIGRLARAKPNNERLLRGFKRDLSQEFQPAPLQLDGTTYTAATTTHIFLAQVFQQLRKQQVEATELIVTTPVGAYEAYRHCLEDCARAAGIQRLRFVDESTAAALGYGLNQPGALVLVIDLGGGTLDLSLVRLQKPDLEAVIHAAEVVAKTDRAYGCGGLDIDIWIAEACLAQQGRTRQQVGESVWQNVLTIAERVKIRLSSQAQTQEAYLDESTFETYSIQLNREGLVAILEKQQFLGRLRDAIDEVMERAYARGITRQELDQVVLVGGSSLIPAVQEQVYSRFGRERVRCHQPFEAVALGALALSQTTTLQDHLRHTYALRLYNPYTMQPDFQAIFPSGSVYPLKAAPLALQANSSGQAEVQLVIGELSSEGATEVYYDTAGRLHTRNSTAASSFRPLGKEAHIGLRLDPPGVMGRDRLMVRFAVDASQTLRVSVDDLLTRKALLIDQAVSRLA